MPKDYGYKFKEKKKPEDGTEDENWGDEDEDKRHESFVNDLYENDAIEPDHGTIMYRRRKVAGLSRRPKKSQLRIPKCAQNSFPRS